MKNQTQELVFIPEEIIIRKIYVIRNQKVMLDRDLADLYGVQAIRLREQVKRNIERFPNYFMFQLTEKEVGTMVSQIAIPSKKVLGGALPYVFTEHGVLMLSNVLRSSKAIAVSIKIIDIFVKLREVLFDSNDIRLEIEYIKNKLDNHDKNTDLIFTYLDQLADKLDNVENKQEQVNRKRMGFNQE